MRVRGIGVGFASVVGSFFVYGAHLACGGGRLTPRVVPTAPAQTTSVATPSPSTSASTTAPAASATGSCGCPAPRTTASFGVSGDEKIVIDPLDAEASLEVSYARSAAGKKLVVLSGVVRGYRSDVASERPTTFSIRIAYPEGTTPPPSSALKDLEAHVSTWGAGAQFAPRVYAVVGKSALTVAVTDALVEIRGSLTLKDPASGRSIALDKLSLRKSGTALLPERNAVWKP